MAAAFGDPIGLTYDHNDKPRPQVGDAIVPMSRRTGRPTGRAYLIERCDPVTRGKFAGRRVSIRATVVRLGDLADDVVRHGLWWYDRG